MKKILITFILCLISICSFSQSKIKVFVHKNNSYVEFNESTDIVENRLNEGGQNGSMVYYANCLGYSGNELVEIYKYNNSDSNLDYFGVVKNVFNDEIIYIVTNRKSFTNEDIISILTTGSGLDFTLNLKSGIENKNIRLSVVEESLGIKTSNNIIVDDVHGFTYTFENGVMISYTNNNGYSDDANYVMENLPRIFYQIEKNAKIRYSSEFYIKKYINMQCKYFMNINTNYLRLASNTNINYNYALIYCIFYSGMSLEDFNFLIPDAELVASVDKYIIMKRGTHTFTFNNNILEKD